MSETVLHSEVHVLDTATGVWVWLPNEYRTRRETEQPTPFSIVNVSQTINVWMREIGLYFLPTGVSQAAGIPTAHSCNCSYSVC